MHVPRRQQREKTQNHRSGNFYRGCNINMWSCHAKYIVTILIKCFNRAWYGLTEIYSLHSLFFFKPRAGHLSFSPRAQHGRPGCESWWYLARLLRLVIDDSAITGQDCTLLCSVHFTRGSNIHKILKLCFTFVKMSHSDKMIQCTCQDSMNGSPKMLITQYFFLCSCISIHFDKEKQRLLSILEIIETICFPLSLSYPAQPAAGVLTDFRRFPLARTEYQMF